MSSSAPVPRASLPASSTAPPNTATGGSSPPRPVTASPARRVAARSEAFARRLMWLSAVVATAGVLTLLVDHFTAVTRAGDDKATVDEMVEQIKSDASVAQGLLDERKQQTEASVERRDRSQVLAWVVLVAGAVFVASGKSYLASRPQRLPRLDELVAIRFAPPPAQKTLSPAQERDDTEKAPDVVAAAPPVAEVADGTADEDVAVAFVDDLIARLGTSREAAIPILQAIQTHFRYLPDAALARVCETTDITPAQVAGTSTFYAQFRRSPVGRHVVRVCHGTACHVAGAELITQELRRHLDIAPGEDTDPQRNFTLDAVACLGCCSLAPVMMIEEDAAGRLTPASARQALDNLETSS